MRRIVIFIIGLSLIFVSCSEKKNVEKLIDGIWEVQFRSQEEMEYWFDSCNFMNVLFFFNDKDNNCSVPFIWKTWAESLKDNHEGYWSVNKIDNQWYLNLAPKDHILEGTYSISFSQEGVFETHETKSINYFMYMKNDKWDLVLKKNVLMLY